MPRSVRKGPFVDTHLANKVAVAAKANDRRPIKTWSRRSMVLPDMVGLTIAIHNGNTIFIALEIDNSVSLFVTTTVMTNRNSPGVVTSARFGLLVDQRTMWLALVQTRRFYCYLKSAPG